MTDVNYYPCLGGAICKPRREMTKAERAAFDAWLDWLNNTRTRATVLGRPSFEKWCSETALLCGITEDEVLSDAAEILGLPVNAVDFMLDMGMELAAEAGESLRENEPELPKVWPSEFHIADIRDKLRQADLLRHGLEGAL